MAQYSLTNIKYSADNKTEVSPQYSLALGQIFGSRSGSKGALGALGSNKDIETSQSYNLPVFGSRYNSDSETEDPSNPFMSYKNLGGGRMTQHYSSASQNSQFNLLANKPLDNLASRKAMSDNGVLVQNKALTGWVYTTQTLGNANFSTFSCTSDADCLQYNADGETYTCNPNYASWNDVKGNQTGPICSRTVYPELHWKKGDKQIYNRKLANEGGIGSQCNTNNDCAEGYECNLSFDFVGSSNQNSGYCSQAYTCPDGQKRFLGTPYNSLMPIPPSTDQNNNGKGYRSESECLNDAMATQRCVQQNGAWFAVYPGYCPMPANLRKGGNPQGALLESSQSVSNGGFRIEPGLSNAMPSALGSSAALQAMSSNVANNDSVEPLQYLQSLNGATKQETTHLGMLFGK